MEEEIIFNIETPGAAEARVTLESLAKANKELREERKKLDLESESGKKRVNEINQSLDKNNQLIKENVSALEKQKINIGNYGSALDRVIPGLGGMIQGVQGATQASKAFIATPIGAILAALAVVIGVVVAAFKKFEPVLDFFENIVTQASAVIDVFLSNIKAVGDILVKLATFDVKGAIEAVKGLTGEFVAAAKAAQLYLDNLRELEDAQNLFVVSSASAEAQMKALIIASKNRNLSFDEQKKKIEEALKIEKELTAQRVELARKEEVIKIKQIALDRGLRQAESETFDQFVQRLLTGKKLREDELELSNEQRQEVAKLSAARINAETETLAFQEKAANMLAAIDEKKQAAYEKSAALAQKEAEAITLRNEALTKSLELISMELEMRLQIDEAEINRALRREEEAQRMADSIVFQNELEEEVTEQYDAQTQKRIALAKWRLNEEKKTEAQRVAGYGQAAGQIATLFKQESQAYKLLRTGQAVIDTYAAATAALAPPPAGAGPILGRIFAAIAIATGLKNIATIQGVSFAAGGGQFMTKGPQLLVVGDNPGGVEKVTVEPISGRGQTKVSNGLIKMAGGGSVIAGTAVRSESNFNMNSLIRQLADRPVVVTVEDINEGQQRVSMVESRAQVL